MKVKNFRKDQQAINEIIEKAARKRSEAKPGEFFLQKIQKPEKRTERAEK
jgi:hypothetical protein